MIVFMSSGRCTNGPCRIKTTRRSATCFECTHCASKIHKDLSLSQRHCSQFEITTASHAARCCYSLPSRSRDSLSHQLTVLFRVNSQQRLGSRYIAVTVLSVAYISYSRYVSYTWHIPV